MAFLNPAQSTWNHCLQPLHEIHSSSSPECLFDSRVLLQLAQIVSGTARFCFLDGREGVTSRTTMGISRGTDCARVPTGARSRVSDAVVSLALCRRRVSCFNSSAVSAKTSRDFAALAFVLFARFEVVLSVVDFFVPARGFPFGQPLFFGASEASLITTSVPDAYNTDSSGGVCV